jgi:hypothetical protein
VVLGVVLLVVVALGEVSRRVSDVGIFLTLCDHIPQARGIAASRRRDAQP